MLLLYVNVYAVTRHYGGPEEGGWWYNAGEPLASVPVAAEERRGCSRCGMCARCAAAERGDEGAEFCKALPAAFDELSDEEAARVEAAAPIATHLVPVDNMEVGRIEVLLEQQFADVAVGNISSMRGGVEVRVSVEEHFARPWPEGRPRYE